VLRVAFAGTPEFALPALAALRAQHDVVGVLTQPDRPSGRGRKLTPGAVKRAALEAGLPLAQPPTLNSEALRNELLAWRPEVLVVVAYGLILPREVLLIPPLGCINIHASLLPRWRGAAPIQRALLAGDIETGVTIMQMDEGLDSGPLLLQRRLAIRADHTSGSLHDELAALGAAALLEALRGISERRLSPRAQPAEGITYAPKIEKAEARIDWKSDAAWIARQVRAFNPWPVAHTSLDGERLQVLEAEVVPPTAYELILAANMRRKDPKSVEPGGIVAINGESLIVCCGRGGLALTRVQRPGRRAVTGREYSQGSDLIGRRLG
jgi:methionyl-tRNA formyltransferase